MMNRHEPESPREASSPDASAMTPTAEQARRQVVGRFLSSGRGRSLAAVAALCAVVGLSAGWATSQ